MKRFSYHKWLVQSVFVLIAVLLLCWLFSQISADDWKQIIYIFKHINYWLVLLGLLIIIASHICRSERWLILIDGKTKNSFSWNRSHNAFGALMIGYLANMLVPRIGEVIRCTTLSKYEKASSMQLIGTIIIERAFDFCCLILVFLITLIVQFDVLAGFFVTLLHIYWKNLNIVLVLFILLVVIIVLFFLFRLLVKKVPALLIWIKDIKQGILSVKDLRKKKTFLLYTVLMWILYVAGVRFAFILFEETIHLSWAVALAIIAVGSVAMILTQGGIGAYQLMIMKILSLYGISQLMGFAVGWLLWLMLAFVAIFFGALSYFILPPLNKKPIT